MANLSNPTKVVTGNVVFSYLNCWDPKAAQPGATAKVQCQPSYQEV